LAASNAPGSVCTKSGQVAKSGAQTVKCLKVGKKLLWQKVVVPVPKATVSPTPSVSPTPKPSLPNGPANPGDPCSVEGETQVVGTGTAICKNGKWAPGGPANSAGETTTATTIWGYLSSITSGNGLGNVSDASLVQEPNGKIRMYFKNGNDSAAALTGFDNYIHSAESADGGISWTIESGVRMQVTSPVEVLPKTGGGYQAWGWVHAAGGNDTMYYAESADGLTFTQITIPGLDVNSCKTSTGTVIGPLGDPAVVHLANGTWLLHAQGFGVGNTGPEFSRWACVATSPDGKTWTAVQSRSYGGTIDVETNPNIYINKNGKVEWTWPTSDGLLDRVGDGVTYGDVTTYIKGADPDRLDLSDGTELMAFGGFDGRAGGVITVAKKYTNSFTISKLSATPDPLGPNVNQSWSVKGATEDQISVFNFALNKNVKDLPGATVTISKSGSALLVNVHDPKGGHGIAYILVGSQKIIG
jgi:hypothetical protein